jgi:hypothetical protein
MPFDRTIYFDSVRQSLFAGHMGEDQVFGQDTILSAWEKYAEGEDVRWLAYMLATTYHETAQEMLPIEEYGKGAGQPYGEIDPETGQTYYGRGFVQLTWRDNYARADVELGLADDQSCEWDAKNALVPWTAARVMFKGMAEGWFRGDALGDWFNPQVDDAYNAREIINGDKSIVPSWSNGVSIGKLIQGYHQNFLTALEKAKTKAPSPPPSLPPGYPLPTEVVDVAISAPLGVKVNVKVNGKDV